MLGFCEKPWRPWIHPDPGSGKPWGDPVSPPFSSPPPLIFPKNIPNRIEYLNKAHFFGRLRVLSETMLRGFWKTLRKFSGEKQGDEAAVEDAEDAGKLSRRL